MPPLLAFDTPIIVFATFYAAFFFVFDITPIAADYYCRHCRCKLRFRPPLLPARASDWRDKSQIAAAPPIFCWKARYSRRTAPLKARSRWQPLL